jgi:hypothetical protein
MSSTLPTELLEPLVRVFDWAMGHEAAPGELICREHRVEHTGKSANVAILGLELFRWTGEARFRDAVVRLGLRIASRLEREDTSPCFTFRPGRHDPFNCSNSVIDGGAASDALASLVAHAEELGLTADERHTLAFASLRHAQSYLRYAAVDKGIPAQRAWALTGLTAALPLASEAGGALAQEAFEPHAQSTDPDKWPGALRSAAHEALGILRGIQHADGSFPYHPHSWGPGHPGAADASSFYQSRVTGFMAHAVTALGEDPIAEPHRTSFEAGLAFLAGLYGPDGLKVGLVEAKPWYWGATYEVASHVFDAHVLGLGWRLLGNEAYGRLALASFRTWAAHLASDGAPTSHRPGPGRGRSYQCPMFWASHAAWAGRALGDLKGALDAGLGEGPLELAPAVFADAELVRLAGPDLVAFVRGARPPGNVNHGSVHGAGLLRVVPGGARLGDDRAELVERCRFGGAQLGEWTGKAGGISLGRGWRAGKDEVRFALWTLRAHWRGGRRLDSVLEVPRVFKRAVLAFAHPRVSSAFARDVKLEVRPDGEVEISGALAWRDGTPVPGTRLTRRFHLNSASAGLVVHDQLEPGERVRGLSYRLPPGAVELESPQEGLVAARTWRLAATHFEPENPSPGPAVS